MLKKRSKLGRKMDEITLGEKLSVTEKIEDKDLLLYLGLTNDSNPLYIQHDYASQTPYEKPIVPTIMLTGIVTTAVTKYLPGPGSHVVRQELEFVKPVYHYTTLQIHFEVVSVYPEDHFIEMQMVAYNEQEEEVIKGLLTVAPPHHLTTIFERSLDNF
ncbi:MaoC family dehydratase [Bacillus sp. NPDC077411]|uniref:MaoC/PaaZ C-terminal domain-containing protein n=1 Tax=Bacillus bruguierae TaxID=3127667 RepID=A0ABU8FBD0_9BACI|nr:MULTISPECIES: MaoC/PaaZ C-terminal domain-containing protein [unclassified Bacillus (in: firmicutes)]SFJ26438.1 Acyl dehydratase [Bacillus sp. 71mf]SFS55024.1 Acyl dehydratase [Bacillus sp. 103mf]